MAKVQWKMNGHYIKNCNCISSCPCDTTGYPYPNKGCEGVVAMEIVKGNYGKVKLDGLHWAAVVRWPGALHEGNGTLQALIDEKANQQQRDALLQVLSGKAGGTLFEILSSIVTTSHPPQFVPFRFEFNKKKRRARLSIPGFVETATEPLKVPATGGEQRVVVRMPDGFEYKQMEVASAVALRSTGAIQFEHHNTHSSLADVEHTHRGLVA